MRIHDGCFKNPMTQEKIAIQRAKIPHMLVDMDGSMVFNFVQREVPPAVQDVVKRAGHTMDGNRLFFVSSTKQIHATEIGRAVRSAL